MSSKRSSALQIIEMNGNRYASLELAQVVALGDVAQAVSNVVRECLAKEKLIVVDGRVELVDGFEE